MRRTLVKQKSGFADLIIRLSDRIRPGHNARDEGLSRIEHAMAGLKTKTQSFQDTYDMHKDEALSRSFQVQNEALDELKAMGEMLKDCREKQDKMFQLIQPTINLFVLLSEPNHRNDRIQCTVKTYSSVCAQN